MAKARKLALEQLEDRATPTFGIAWPDPTHVTLSFAPDGTSVNGVPSNLSQLLGPLGDPAWKQEVFRAFQTWAAVANVNVGLVADGGQPLGASGASQGDARFGDIRVAARPLTLTSDLNLAGGSGFDYSGNTWVGDVYLNSQYGFGLGNAPGQYDLYSVLVHEAAHSFGLADTATDPSSALYQYYTYRTGLSASDVSVIRALYGPRQPDAFEGGNGNDTWATATNTARKGSPNFFAADLSTLGDVDYYKILPASAGPGADGLTVRVQTSGLSLLVPKLTVYDAAGNVLGTATSTGPAGGDLAVAVPNFSRTATYYARVEGATGDVFSVGAYNLVLDYHHPGDPATSAPASLVYDDGHTDDKFATATNLKSSMTILGEDTHFAFQATVSDASDVDYYRFNPKSSTAVQTLTVTLAALEVNALRPMVTVYDTNKVVVPSQVVENDSGTFTVQMPNAVMGVRYFLKVAALDPSGSHGTGLYQLTIDANPAAPIQYRSLTGGSLSAATSKTFNTLTVGQTRLMQFTLSASTVSPAAAAVRMTIFDATGHAVFSMVAFAGQPLSTGTVLLGAGNYTVVFNAATKDGSLLSGLSYALGQRVLSDPIDAYPTDGGNPGTTISGDLPDTPVILIDPISDPYAFV
jgi:hypothetical protein